MEKVALTIAGMVAAVAVTTCLYRLASFNTFVDKRKDVLRDLVTKLRPQAPELLILVQNLGKHSSIDPLLPRIIGRQFGLLHAPVVEELARQILGLRRRYRKVMRRFAFYLLLWILIGLASAVQIEDRTTAWIVGIVFAAAALGAWLAQIFVELSPPGTGIAGFGARAIDAILAREYRATYRDRVALLAGQGERRDRFHHRYDAALRQAVQVGRWSAGGALLDLGCGDGALSVAELEAGLVVRQDVSVPSLKAIAARKVSGECPVMGDALRCPFADGSFDLVVLIEVFEHLLSPRELLQEAARVLAPGGVLVVTAPHVLNKYNLGVGRRSALDPRPGDGPWPPGEQLWHLWRDAATGLEFPHRLLSEGAFRAEIRACLGPGDLQLGGSSATSAELTTDLGTSVDTLIATWVKSDGQAPG